jgi:hypothetical protein
MWKASVFNRWINFRLPVTAISNRVLRGRISRLGHRKDRNKKSHRERDKQLAKHSSPSNLDADYSL